MNLAFGAKTVDKLGLFPNAESAIVVALDKVIVEIRVFRNARLGTVVIERVSILTRVKTLHASNIPLGIDVKPVLKIVASVNPLQVKNRLVP